MFLPAAAENDEEFEEHREVHEKIDSSRAQDDDDEDEGRQLEELSWWFYSAWTSINGSEEFLLSFLVPSLAKKCICCLSSSSSRTS